MGKAHKRTRRGDQYETMAAGYQILRSPLAAAYGAAAEHYQESDSPLDPPGNSEGSGAGGVPNPEPDDGGD
jgi:hypothetical protein